MIQLKATKAGTCFNLRRVVAGVRAIRDGLDKALTPPHGQDCSPQEARSHPAPFWFCTLISNPLSVAAFFPAGGRIHAR